MSSLSVIVATFNEEENLPQLLKSISFADEVVICDSGSTDRTVEIAREHGCLVVHKRFDGFGPAKQAALVRATGDWVLSLDADERLDDVAAKEIRSALNGQFTGYRIKRRSFFLGRWLRHSGWYPDWVLRLFRREQGCFGNDLVHEGVTVDGEIARLEGHILHYTDPSLTHYLKKLNRYTSLSAEMLYRQGKRFHFWHLFKPPFLFWKMYLLKLGFLDGFQGLLLALLSSFHVFCKYVKLWELQRQ
jgi:glycosyltransferase involved in cell wall biosynthesis